jgi:two-component system response regulator PilR (NtrC family)/two-component system response regulator AtoC
MITGFGSVESAVEAMRLGAYDYLEKPFKLDDLKLCIHRALNYTKAVAENTFLRRELKTKYGFSQIIGASAAMQAVFRMVERVADTDATILILGQSGTGKELVARALHYNSRRNTGPFIPINCSALPENLLESELFGHRKGAFTGAINDKNGLFHDADGGTIFLDEIGTMPAQLQSRLLRVLQEKEVRRVGDNTPTYVNVRVLAATNENLEQLVRDGKFREDLYYRLNVVPITLPALKQRADDIPMLVAHFLKDKVHPRTGQSFQISRRALAALGAHEWPGNVRELENAIERACLLCESTLLRVQDLPPVVQKHAGPDNNTEETELARLTTPVGNIQNQPGSNLGPSSSASGQPTTGGHTSAKSIPLPQSIVSLKKFARDQELAYIQHVLSLTNQNKEETARLIDISLATLYRKIAGDGE